MVVIATVAALAVVQLAAPSGARAEDWCWGDPVIRIGNDVLMIQGGVKALPQDARANVRLATYTITVPQGVSTDVIRETSPFFPERVEWVRGPNRATAGQPFTVHITLTFDSRATYQARMTVRHHGDTFVREGTTAGRIDLDITLR